MGRRRGGGDSAGHGKGVGERVKESMCVCSSPCVSVPVVSFLRAEQCWGWSAPCVQPQTLLQQNSHTPSSSSSSSTASSSHLLQLFPTSFLNLSASVYCPFTVEITSFTSLYFFCLSPSHTFSPIHALILMCPPSLLPSLPPCPPLSLLIRPICWRGRQGDLRMDRIVLYVESVVQCWSHPCGFLYRSVARVLVFVCTVERESDGTCGPDFIRFLSALSISPFLWVSIVSSSLLSCCLSVTFISPSS